MKVRVTLLCASVTALALALLGAAPPTASNVGHFTEYAVAADHPTASAIGAEILAQGGTAADAAAATMLALGVENPASSGFGGGGFALYYRASDQSLTFLDFRETAPAAATATMFDDNEERDGRLTRPSQYGGLASGVPGEPAGVAELVSRFGALPLAKVVAPAIALAQRGAPVSSVVARMSASFVDQLRADPIMRRWLPRSGTLEEGARLRRPALARTLRAFARGGPSAIYQGPIAAAIVEANRANGGVMTVEDLAAYRVVTRRPIEARRLGYRWVTAPPPSAGGYMLLASLAFLEGIGDRGYLENLHALAESWKGPALDRQRYFGDPDHVDVPLAAMLDGTRVGARARLFDPDRAVPTAEYSMPLEPETAVEARESQGTSHLCVVDAEGNVASVTTTVNLPFGARYTAAGLVMNDEMDDFASAVDEQNAFHLPGGARNLPGPGRRPVSSMSPTIVFDERGPVLCVGASGGSRIPSAVEQVALNILRDGLPAEWAVARPRIHHQGIPETLGTEGDFPLSDEAIAYLEALGHAHALGRNVAVTNIVQIVRGERPGLVAVSDPRKVGRPAGR